MKCFDDEHNGFLEGKLYSDPALSETASLAMLRPKLVVEEEVHEPPPIEKTCQASLVVGAQEKREQFTLIRWHDMVLEHEKTSGSLPLYRMKRLALAMQYQSPRAAHTPRELCSIRNTSMSRSRAEPAPGSGRSESSYR